MEHRGATSADRISGDGAGVLTGIPWKLFRDICDPAKSLNGDGTTACAVGMIFLPFNEEKLAETVRDVERIVGLSGMKLLGWRQVPVDTSVLGELAAEYVPNVRQMVLSGEGFKTQQEFESALYAMRREIQGLFRVLAPEGEIPSYVCSLSSKTIVYKGMLRSCDLPAFYSDLTNPEYETSFALYHRRFSTNTVPKWFLAQPMRLLAHNGEINTLLGNINWVRSREIAMAQEHKISAVRGPLVDVGRSDSANLDSIFENYVNSGRSPEEALMMLVPEAFFNQPKLATNKQVRDFYEYFEGLQEAWDGPALLVFSDGNVIGATLDRNGLRPARYMVTADKNGKETVHVMSEVGVTKSLNQFADEGSHSSEGEEKEGEEGWVSRTIKGLSKATAAAPSLVEAGRLGPGEMMSVDLREGKLYLNDEIKSRVSAKHPYASYIEQSTTLLPKQPFSAEMSQYKSRYVPIIKEAEEMSGSSTPKESYSSMLNGDTEVDDTRLLAMQTVMGWGSEDVEVQLSAMASTGIEATYCMVLFR